MCGICGLVYRNKTVDVPEIKNMVQCLKHRGPDLQDFKIWQNVALGHDRLSIIDLTTGNQPMSSADQKVWIVFNGEIYNFKQIKKELSDAGFSFFTNSDTEVIINSYRQWGNDCVRKLRGMFAFAIFDLEKQQIFIARDHIGIKPLYYFHNEKTFAFASELQSLKTLNDFNKELNLQSIDTYLCLQYIPAPHTVYKNIFKLEPGTSLLFDIKKFSITKEKFWNINYRPDLEKTEEEILEETEKVLSDSVKAHLVSDVSFGAFLSGGIDSTLVVQYMSRILDQPVKTFSIGFEEKDFDESAYASYVAKELKTEHHHELVKPDALAILPGLVKHYGEPFGDSSAIPTYYVSKMARQHVKMVLSGDGGDELFGGYHSYKRWMDVIHQKGMKLWKQKLYPVAAGLFPERYPEPENLQNWISIINYFDLDSRKRLWKEEYHSLVSNRFELFENIFEKTSDSDAVQRAQLMDLNTYLPNDILTKVDVASMMHSLEVRTPLVDKQVWEFAVTIPSQYYFNYSNNTYEGKKILKKILEKKFPKDFTNRKKMGFAVPLNKWFSDEGKSKLLIHEKLVSESSGLPVFFNRDFILSMIKNKDTNGLWLLLFLEEWLNQNK